MSELNIYLELLDHTSNTDNEPEAERCPDLCPMTLLLIIFIIIAITLILAFTHSGSIPENI